MSIIVGEETKLVVSGLTGREGSFHGLRNRAYGTYLAAGVTPGKGGQDVEGVPIFDSIKESVEEAGANTSMIFVPARFAAPAIDEAIESGVHTVIAITEGIPVLDMLKTYWKAKEAGVRLIGPNCPGVLSPGKANVGIIPAQFIWFVAGSILMGLIYKRHTFGSHVLFIGDNAASARMMGIHVDTVKILCFVIMGVSAALSVVFILNQLTFFWATTGSGYLLTTLAAVFIGGTSVFGGRGTMIGTFVGVLIIASLEPGIIAVGLTGFWTQFIYGLLIMALVLFLPNGIAGLFARREVDALGKAAEKLLGTGERR